MKLDFWNWFKIKWEDLIGKGITWLSMRDGNPQLSWEDVKIAAELIKDAEIKFGTGTERRAWVLEQLRNVYNIVIPHLLELVFWTALNYAQQRGWIQLGDKK